MTERLYYTDARLTEFTARVVEIAGDRVYLDRTAFYPTSGGQLFDTGMLGDARVVDVVDEKERIAHVLEKPARFAANDELKARVDWTRRFDHMQQHTGQHLLSAVFDELFGHKTVSVHFGDESSTLDLDAASLSKERALKAERRANEIVFENRAISVTFEDAASATGLRKAVDRTGDLRIVEIAGIDRSGCGGTHVRRTGDIGIFKIMVEQSAAAGVRRIEAITGDAALLPAGLRARPPAWLIVRPEHLHIDPGPWPNQLDGIVEDLVYAGAATVCRLRVGSLSLSMQVPGETTHLSLGARVSVGWHEADSVVLHDT